MKHVIKIICSLTILLILFSCNNSSDKIKEEITFDNLILSKNNTFIEESISLTIEGSEFNTSFIESSSDKIIIEKKDETNYILSSNEAVNSSITINLSNGEEIKNKIVKVNFYNHGTKNFEIVEGLKIDNDYKEKVIELHGEPNIDTVLNNIEKLYYYEKGFLVYINTNTNLVTGIELYGRAFRSTIEGNDNTWNVYPYEIANIGSFLDVKNLLMNNVVDNLGIPQEWNKKSSSGVVSYTYNDIDKHADGAQKATFVFFGSEIDNYVDKQISIITID